eukprot:scaffold20403_cov94-Skeletonema_dohrnii-CCMP3373.AAC.2
MHYDDSSQQKEPLRGMTWCTRYLRAASEGCAYPRGTSSSKCRAECPPEEKRSRNASQRHHTIITTLQTLTTTAVSSTTTHLC